MQQQQAGGLPQGYTELEYLESSGTQYIDTGFVLDEEAVVETNYFSTRFTGAGIFGYREEQNKNAFGLSANDTYMIYGDESFNIPQNPQGGTLKAEGREWLLNELFHLFDSQFFEKKGNCYIFTINTNGAATPQRMLVGRIFYFSATTRTKRIKLIPALDPGGVPCMYDLVSRQPYYNAGTGTFGYRIKASGEAIATFARRDPYYTAPSGVYARLIAENTLDILADTDIDPDAAEQAGYTWHPNTGDSYTAYNITPSPETTA